MGHVAQEMLQEKISSLEMAIQSLEKEKNALAAQIAQQELTEEQVGHIIDEFSEKVDKGLFYAETDFDIRRQLVEALDLEGTLAMEDGQRVIYVRCILGDTLLPVLNVDWQLVDTITPKPLVRIDGPFITTQK
jgi:hypothetical protein